MAKKYSKYTDNKPKYRLNHQITASEVRLIGADDKQVGVLPLTQAIKQARELELDLIEIAPKANPPVVKIADFKKFQYQENKKLSAQAKKVKKGQLKEIRFKLFIGQADYQYRINKTIQFLKQSHRVRITIPFFGRQLAHKNLGYELAKKIVDELQEVGKVDQDPKFVGRKLIMSLSPQK